MSSYRECMLCVCTFFVRFFDYDVDIFLDYCETVRVYTSDFHSHTYSRVQSEGVIHPIISLLCSESVDLMCDVFFFFAIFFSNMLSKLDFYFRSFDIFILFFSRFFFKLFSLGYFFLGGGFIKN